MDSRRWQALFELTIPLFRLTKLRPHLKSIAGVWAEFAQAKDACVLMVDQDRALAVTASKILIPETSIDEASLRRFRAPTTTRALTPDELTLISPTLSTDSCTYVPLMAAHDSTIGIILVSGTLNAEEQTLLTNITALSIQNIMAYEAKETQINYLREHDSLLTQLPNRLLLLRTLTKLLNEAEMNQRVAIFFIDVDDFKTVNKRYGHNAGDNFLSLLAERLRALANNLPVPATLARMGGDEFVLVLSKLTALSDIEKYATEVLGLFETPMMLEDNPLTISVSVGASIYPEHGNNADDLLRLADEAMYQAKADGKNRFYIAVL